MHGCAHATAEQPTISVRFSMPASAARIITGATINNEMRHEQSTTPTQ